MFAQQKDVCMTLLQVHERKERLTHTLCNCTHAHRQSERVPGDADRATRSGADGGSSSDDGGDGGGSRSDSSSSMHDGERPQPITRIAQRVQEKGTRS